MGYRLPDFTNGGLSRLNYALDPRPFGGTRTWSGIPANSPYSPLRRSYLESYERLLEGAPGGPRSGAWANTVGPVILQLGVAAASRLAYKDWARKQKPPPPIFGPGGLPKSPRGEGDAATLSLRGRKGGGDPG